MQKVDIPKFRKEIAALIEANRDMIENFETKDSQPTFIFTGKHYTCEVSLDENWIGYEIDINTPDGMSGCGLRNDTDLYPIHGGKNEEAALEIYDELLDAVKALLSSRIYYSSNEKFSYTAIKHEDGKYDVSYWKRKKLLLLWPYSTGWAGREYSEADFKKLNLQVLS